MVSTKKQTPAETAGGCLTLILLIALGLWACSRTSAEQTPAPVASPTADVREEVKAEAVDLLGAAVAERQVGRLGIALEMARQALGKWPGYADAQAFTAEVAPQATAQAEDAIAQATAAAERGRFMPGLTSADIRVNLEQRGFVCNVQAGGGRQSWHCKERSNTPPFQQVLYSGEDVAHIDYISASVTNCPHTAIPLASDFLGYVATLPYDGSTPSRSRQWVEQQVRGAPDAAGVHGEMVQGGVRFEVFGPACGRFLKITAAGARR